MKKNRLQTVALIVCLAFFVSAVPALQGSEKKAVKSSAATSLKSTFRIVGYLFPLLSPLADLIKSDGRDQEIVDHTNGPNLLPRPTSDAPSTNEPRTKD